MILVSGHNNIYYVYQSLIKILKYEALYIFIILLFLYQNHVYKMQIVDSYPNANAYTLLN